MRFSVCVLLSGTVLIWLVGCANRNKADVIDTRLDKAAAISQQAGSYVGVRDKEFVLQRKKNLAEELRSLEENVRQTDDRVYGTRAYETSGLWGKLQECRNRHKDESSDLDAGKLERFSDSEYLLNWADNSDAKAVVDKDSEKLMAISDEDLSKYITRFGKEKKRLQAKEDEIKDKLAKCQQL